MKKRFKLPFDRISPTDVLENAIENNIESSEAIVNVFCALLYDYNKSGESMISNTLLEVLPEFIETKTRMDKILNKLAKITDI